MRDAREPPTSDKVRSHHDLKVWRLGLDITERVYQVTKDFPREETYGITSQLRRAASSIPANIAEGSGRDSAKDYLRHLSIAIGSLCEVETFVQIALRLKYLDPSDAQPLFSMLEEESRMIRGLQRSLRSTLP